MIIQTKKVRKMEKTNLLALVVTLTVGIILAGSMLMPVLENTTATNATITNNGLYRMSEISDEESWVIAWDSSDSRVVDVNGETVALHPTAGGIALTLLGGSDLMVRYLLMPNDVRIYVQVFSTGNTVYSADSNSGQDMTITYNGSTVVCDNGSGTTLTLSITDKLYAVDPDGDFVMKKSTESAMVKEDSPIIGIGTTELANNVDQRFVITGTLADGFTAEYEPYDTMTMGDITATAPAHNGTYLEVYDFEKLTFTATYDGSDIPVTYSQVLVPYQITAELAQHLDAGSIALLNALPILVIIGLVMAAVGAIYIRNRD